MVSRIRLIRPIVFFIGITLFAGNHRCMRAQELSTPLPPAAQGRAFAPVPDAPKPGDGARETVPYPIARVVPAKEQGTKVVLESTNPQTRTGTLYTLDKDVVITYGDRTIRADHIEYDSDSGDVTATGHLEVSGGPNNEHIIASHGTLNVKAQTGTFYDVSGSVGLHRAAGSKTLATRVVYDNGNPFLFTGRVVVKKGPQEYDVLDGSVTSCQLPKPDWLLNAALFSIDGDKARAKNSVFHLLNVPLLYTCHTSRIRSTRKSVESGLLMVPVLGDSSSKGITFGEEVYFVL